jgi:Fe-S-cluster containining protein
LSDQDTAKTETVKAELRIGKEKIRFSAMMTNEPVHLYDLLPFFQNITNKVIEIAIKEAVDQGKTISCKMGCCACCHQLIPISWAEGLLLLQQIDSMSPEHQQAVRARFKQNLAAVKASGIYEEMDQMVNRGDRNKRREIGIAYMNLNLPCPFLHEQSCSVYQNRPLSCREFMVTSDPVYCIKPDPERVEVVVLPRRVSNVVFDMSRQNSESNCPVFPLTQLLERSDELQSGHVSKTAIDLIKQFLLTLGKSQT